MQSFTCADNKTWHFRLTIGIAESVRDELSIDLLDIGGDLLREIYTKPREVAKILWICGRGDPRNQGATTEADFVNGIAGETLEAAMPKLMEELISFFPQAVRTHLRTAIETFDRTVTTGAIPSVAGDSSSRVPESSAFTPGG